MLTVAILAGGKSTRMGTDKALVELAGKPLIAHVVERLRPLKPGEFLVICRQPDRYAFLDLPMYEDVIPDLGPVGGLLTALRRARYDHVVLVGCDLPFASPTLLAALVRAQNASGDTFDAVVPRWQGRYQPLHALYHTRCAERVAQRIASGEQAFHRLLKSLHIRVLDEQETAQLEPDGKAFTNLNTPDDLLAAEAEHRARASAASRGL